ncbi:pyridoxal phosphate-dependent aminotransferase [Bryobacter aggregatus]|uniref:pyridoxal phosphate-dependent aminotransferase n=1 Tax=Bryobacter aggregatus TaxID=360054 RepID=UPI00068F0C98|nr:pyridoxal phosphate-dependent aminotransferase [Bryobacter aggregatus]
MGPVEADRGIEESTTLPPFSNRFPWRASPNRIAQQLAAKSRPRIDLSISNPTQARLALPDPFSMSALGSEGYAPSATGAAHMREAVSRYYAEEFGSSVRAEDVLLTTSTSEAYSYCFKMIAEPGATVLLPEPSYPLLRFLVEAEGLVAASYPLHEAHGQWILDRERLLAACDTSTRAVVVVNPNNPTGHFLSSEDAAWLSEVAGEQFWVVCDEVFADYAWGRQPSQSLTQLPVTNVLCLSGLSKICALPQMKLGWIVMPPDEAVRKNLELVADTYLSVSSPIQEAAVRWLERRAEFQLPIRERCQANLATIQASVQDTAWALLPVEAGWAAILRGPASMDEEDLVLSLLEQGIIVQPGFYYDLPFPCSLVLSLLTPPEDLVTGLATMKSS